jgi:dienelactone hydrolase
VAKARRVLDAMTGLARDDPRLAGRIDAGAVGFLGYSVGGSVAAEASRSDARIKAVANLDGWLFADAAGQGVPVPYLLISSGEAFPPPSDLRSPDNWTRLSAAWCARDIALHRRFFQNRDFQWFLAEGSDHEGLTDRLFTPTWRDAIKRSWQARLNQHRNIEAAITAFFERYLKGQPAPPVIVAASGTGALRQFTATSQP